MNEGGVNKIVLGTTGQETQAYPRSTLGHLPMEARRTGNERGPKCPRSPQRRSQGTSHAPRIALSPRVGRAERTWELSQNVCPSCLHLQPQLFAFQGEGRQYKAGRSRVGQRRENGHDRTGREGPSFSKHPRKRPEAPPIGCAPLEATAPPLLVHPTHPGLPPCPPFP